MTSKPKPKPLPFIRELKDLQRIKNDLIALRDHLRKNYAVLEDQTPATPADDKAGDAHEQICEVIGILMGVTASLETPS